MPWLRFNHFVHSVYAPPLHFAFAFAWCLALEGALVAVFNVNRGLSWRPSGDTLLEIVSLFLVLFFLRGLDEWKDFDYDSRHNPDRPLVTGKTTFSDLYLYLLGTGVLVLILNLPWITRHSWIPFSILAADMVYGLLLITLERHSTVLKENILLNLVITYPVNIALSVYIYFMTAEKWGPINQGLPIVTAFVCAFLNFEFSRKICWPQHAPTGKRLYSAALGAWKSGGLGLTFACAAVGIMIYEFASLPAAGGFKILMGFLPLLSLFPAFWGSWRFIQARSSTEVPKQGAPMARSSMLFLILFYVTLIICSWASLGSPTLSHAETGQSALQSSPSSFLKLFTASSSIAWINQGTWTLLTSRDDGQNTQKPSSALLEIRPDLKLSRSGFVAIIRPRLSLALSGNDGTPSARAQEAFLMGDITPSLSFAYGLQNYQWGPTESASPSNRIFHETAQSRDFSYEVRGRHIARLNLSWSPQWTTVIMAELTGNGVSPYNAEEKFSPSALAKTEMNWNAGADSVGIVLGGKTQGDSWIGEYFNLSLTDAVSVYGDLSHQLGSQAWYPLSALVSDPVSPSSSSAQPSGVRFAKKRQGSDSLLTYAVTGVRYAFENGTDFRMEVIFNQAGYTLSDWTLIRNGINTSDQGRLASNGLEFPGQTFFYSSLRIPDFFGKRNLNFYSRYLLSAADQSGGLSVGADYAIGQAGTVFGTVLATHGGPQTELHSLLAGAFSAGYRQLW